MQTPNKIPPPYPAPEGAQWVAVNGSWILDWLVPSKKPADPAPTPMAEFSKVLAVYRREETAVEARWSRFRAWVVRTWTYLVTPK